jgi:hypothetical protein
MKISTLTERELELKKIVSEALDKWDVELVHKILIYITFKIERSKENENINVD